MIAIVCTDRDRHPRWFLAVFDPDEPMRPRRDKRRSDQDRERLNSSATAPEGHDPFFSNGSYRFLCKKCGADHRINRADWRRLTERVIAAGVARVDLSFRQY